MGSLEIKKDIFWVGAVDWNIRNFHGYTFSTKNGTTYNAYLILDEKLALIDAVYGPFSDEMIVNIKKIVLPERIDYIVVNHVETDHSGSLPQLLKLCPKAKLFGTLKCKEGLYRHYYGNWDFQIVKTGDRLKLGKKTLEFIEVAMIHWPDSMFTYCPEEQVLFSNDAFGQHYATSERFDDEIGQATLMDEAAKYYANILWPFSSIILKKIEEIKRLNISIKMIATSHGLIWRKDPEKIIERYLAWARNETKSEAVLVYETMWGATEKMARKIAEGIIDSGVKIKFFDINKSDRTEIIKEMLECKGFIFGSSTHDNDTPPNFAGFLKFLKGLKPKNRIAAVFGSYGWAGGAIASIGNILKETGIEIVQPSLGIQFVPDENELARCYAFGRDFAKKIVS